MKHKGDRGIWVALNTASAWASTMTNMLVGFVLTPFLLTKLGDRQYGLLAVASAVSSWCSFAAGPIGIFASRQSTEALARGEPDAVKRIVGTCLSLASIAAFIVLVPVIFCAIFADRVLGVGSDVLGPARAAVVICGLGSAATLVIRVWESTIYMSRRFYLKNISEALARICAAGLIVAYFHYIGPSVGAWLTIGVWLPISLSLVAVLPLAKRGLPVNFFQPAFDREQAWRAMSFVGLLAVGTVGAQLFDATDALVISNLKELGLEKVAPYDIGARWMRLVRPFIEGFILAMSPAIVSLFARKDQAGLARAMATGTRHALLIALIPICSLTFVAKPFIQYWVGAEYVPLSAPVLWIMLAAALFSVPGMFAYHVIVASARLKHLSFGGITAGLFNLALSIGFVKIFHWGLCGVAAGTLVSMVLWSGVMMPILACRYTHVPMLGFFRDSWSRTVVTAAGLAAAGISLALQWHPKSLIETFIMAGTLMVISCVIICVLGLTSAERMTVLERVRGLIASQRPSVRAES